MLDQAASVYLTSAVHPGYVLETHTSFVNSMSGSFRRADSMRGKEAGHGSGGSRVRIGPGSPRGS
eukprot:14976195-Alexandrium_andersonii.AAC.1